MTQDYYASPADVSPITRARSSDVNGVDAAVATAFEKLPAETVLKTGRVTYAVDTGAVNAYVVSLTNAPSQYYDGMEVRMRVTTTNTGASTINVNGLGAKNILTLDGLTPVAGALVANGTAILVFNEATNNFRLLNPATMFGASSSYATLSGVETLYNKTLESPVLNNAAINFTQDGTGAQTISLSSKVKQYVSVFDFLTTAQIEDVVAGTVTLDLTTAIQAAIDACNVKGASSWNASATTLLFPDGVYKITAQLVVKANVNILCDGYIYNALASGTTACMQFKAGSGAERVKVYCNSKSGIILGDSATENGIKVGSIQLSAVGESASQIGVQFVGYSFTVGSIDLDGGNVGVDLGDNSSAKATNVQIGRMRLYSSVTALRVSTGCEHISIGSVICDSCHYLGIQVDYCRDVTISDAEIFFNDADAALGVFTRTYAVEIGTFSGANHVENLTLRCRVVNTATTDNVSGTALKLSNIDRSSIWLDANNGTLASGNAHRIVQALEYGSGVGGTVMVWGNFAASLTVSSGTVAGNLAYYNGTAWIFSTAMNDSKGELRTIPQNIQNTGYTLVLADAGKHTIKTDSTARAHTIPPNSSVAFPIGTVVTFINQGGTTNNLTVTRGGGVTLYRAGVNGDIAVTPGDMVSVIKTATDTWQA